MTARSTWDQCWLEIASAAAKRSRCNKRQVGAVIVTAKNRILATGYNSPPAEGWDGDWTCESCCPRFKSNEGDYRLCPAIHAEANALLFTDRSVREGGTLYVSRAVCVDCAWLVANSGLAYVVMKLHEEDAYREPQRVIDILSRAGLGVRAIEVPNLDGR